MDSFYFYSMSTFLTKLVADFNCNGFVKRTKENLYIIWYEVCAFNYCCCFACPGNSINNAIPITVFNKVEDFLLFGSKFHCEFMVRNIFLLILIEIGLIL